MTITLAGDALIGYLMASLRIVAWLALVPPFSGRAVPVMAKAGIGLGLAFAVGPSVDTAGVASGTPALVMTAVTEVLIGLGMGFVTYLLLTAIATAGSLVDLFGGFALAQGFDPLAMNMNTVFGTFHQMIATTLLFGTGGHLVVIGGLLHTFDFLPVGASPELEGATGVLLAALGMFFTIAVQIALPLIAVLFLADLGLALLTKVAPQLNAINVMFPVKIGLTLLLLGLSLPALPAALERLVDLATQAMAALAGAG